MIISGIQKNSLLDYPDKVATVLFTQGCNFKCGFCHNPQLNDRTFEDQKIPLEKIFDYLAKSHKIIDAVVITGGEPTVHSDLSEFIEKIKNLGYLVKLDTNGSNPTLLKKIINREIIDYIAMDLKAPLGKYKLITATNCNLNNITRSIRLIIKSGLPHEFRTTVLPFWHKQKDIRAMAELVKGAEKYYLQNFVSQPELVSPAFKTAESYTSKQLECLASIVRKIVGHCEVR